MDENFKDFLDEIRTYNIKVWNKEASKRLIEKYKQKGIIKDVKEGYVAVIVESLDEARRLVPVMGNLVGIKALVHVPSDLVQQYGRGKRNILAPYKAHNEKMGANWYVEDTAYRIDRSGGRHFKGSGYEELIRKANEQLDYQLP